MMGQTTACRWGDLVLDVLAGHLMATPIFGILTAANIGLGRCRIASFPSGKSRVMMCEPMLSPLRLRVMRRIQRLQHHFPLGVGTLQVRQNAARAPMPPVIR
jgi:hypothetical protein